MHNNRIQKSASTKAICSLIIALGTSHLAHAAVTSSPFLASGAKLLAIGQDNDSIANYAASLGSTETPGAVTSYIDMDLRGLSTDLNVGAGRINTDQLAASYPNSALFIAIDAVGKLPAINAGNYDANLTTLVQKLVAYKRPIYLRFGYEADGSWNNYDPTQYKTAWVRLYNKIVELKAKDNITMIWHSSSYCNADGWTETTGGMPFTNWYPGDGYVDAVAVSYFAPGLRNNGTGSGTCRTANQAIDAIANFARSKNKPLVIAESTPQGFSVGASNWRPVAGGQVLATTPLSSTQLWSWYNDYFNWIKNNNVRMVAYINADWNSQPMWGTQPYNSGYWGDSRVQANPIIQSGWLSNVAGFVKASPNLFANLGYVSPVSTAIPPTTITTGKTIIVRAKGITGYESVTLRMNNAAIKTWTLTKNMADTNITTNATGNIQLHFTNDNGVNDVQVDYISVNGSLRQAENQSTNTGVWQSGRCGGGAGKSEWMHCNGYIDFGA